MRKNYCLNCKKRPTCAKLCKKVEAELNQKLNKNAAAKNEIKLELDPDGDPIATYERQAALEGWVSNNAIYG